MSRVQNRLSVLQVKAAKSEGKLKKLSDGAGLALYVKKAGKYWRFRYQFDGKAKEISFGKYPDVGLADARQMRDEARKLVAAGINPSERRKSEKASKRFAANDTFKAVALEWLETVHRHKVVESHYNKNVRRLEKHAFPFIGQHPIQELEPIDILRMLREIEKKGIVETAHRVKHLCGQVFRYAVPTGRVQRDITADLRDVLRPPKVTHHAAITEPEEIKILMKAIHSYRGYPGTENALKLAAILFMRPGELRQLKWTDLRLEDNEFDYSPSKSGSPMIVPLPKQAIELFQDQYAHSADSEYVFPSIRSKKRPMSDNTLRFALESLGFKEKMTPHGFRAMARTVLAERLNFPTEYIEMQLAHAVRDPNGRAYNRTTYLKQRKEMLQAWADYLEEIRAGAERNGATVRVVV